MSYPCGHVIALGYIGIVGRRSVNTRTASNGLTVHGSDHKP